MKNTLIVLSIILVFFFVVLAVHETGAQKPDLKKRVIPFETTEGITMVSIPGGSFQMGSNNSEDDEKPVHEVTLDGFEIGATEVTQGQYKEVMGENPSHFKGNDMLPAERVTWIGAASFCNKLSEKKGFEPCYDENSWACDFTKNGFRLPTEAEWEYACRAGTSTNYYTGNDESDLARAGWYGNDRGNSDEKSHPVARKEPNAWGLYDMHGNILEWCYDWEGEYESGPQKNPAGGRGGGYRILRGGSWFNGASYCRSTFRIGDRPDRTSNFSGFRIVQRVK